jgi:hypothetical protein
MNLYNSISASIQTATVPSDLEVYKESYKILSEIVAVIRDETLNDIECFYKIDAIIAALDRRQIDAGFRHDF